MNGTDGPDNFDGTLAADTIMGFAGDDDLSGGGGDDVIADGDGADEIYGGDGNDTLNGGAGTDVIESSGLRDAIDGGRGNDILNGGTGADTLTGGSGADRFIYTLINDSLNSARDLITDFTATDILDLSAIDANSALTGDQAFGQTAAFGGVAGQFTLVYNAATRQTLLQADVDGNNIADFAILFAGDVTGFTGNWIL